MHFAHSDWFTQLVHLGYQLIYFSLTLYGKCCAKRCYKANNFLTGKRNFSLNKAKKDQCRRLEVREKARNVFCDEPMSV